MLIALFNKLFRFVEPTTDFNAAIFAEERPARGLKLLAKVEKLAKLVALSFLTSDNNTGRVYLFVVNLFDDFRIFSPCCCCCVRASLLSL